MSPVAWLALGLLALGVGMLIDAWLGHRLAMRRDNFATWTTAGDYYASMADEWEELGDAAKAGELRGDAMRCYERAGRPTP